MYPTLYHAFKDILGVDWPWAKLLNSFGFFVAMAFVAASITLSKELQRKGQLGLLPVEKRLRRVGEAPQIMDLVSNGLIGFILGWKFVYLIVNSGRLFQPGTTPQRYIFSLDGYWLMGLLVGAGFAYWRYREVKKQQLPQPKEEVIEFHMYEYTGTITFMAAIFGIAGAKLFHLFENPREFMEFFSSPSLESFLSGLTVYGGLILGAAACLVFAKRKGIPILHLTDAATPGIILAYGIGRIGCQVSGDGDWGIVNTADKPGWMSFLPDWLWAYDYPNNVNGIGVPLEGGVFFEGYGTHLVPPVFPTPVYETIMAVSIFALLWFLRKRMNMAGMITALYLIFNGTERFFIEKIRVNNKMDFLGMRITQAELISVCFILAGLIMAIWVYRKNKKRSMNAQ